MALIPGLTDDLARECLIRIPFKSLRAVLSVCKAWNSEIRSPEFHRLRKSSGQTRPVFILAKANRVYSHDSGWEDFSRPRFCQLTLFDPESRSWTRLPQGPFHVELLPVCGVVGVGSKVIVITAGWHFFRGVINMVNVYDLLTGQWHSSLYGMPGPGRCSFRLCGDPVRQRVLLTGGFGAEGYANERPIMTSAYMYDVADDTWTQLNDVNKEMEEYNVVFHSGTFHVISRVEGVESLDSDTLEWGPIDDEFLEDSKGEGYWTVTGNGEGEVYCMGREVAVRRGGDSKWEVVSEVPDEIGVRKCVMTWRGKMVVIAGKEVNKAYVLELKSGERIKEDVPDEYSEDGNVLGCGIEL